MIIHLVGGGAKRARRRVVEATFGHVMTSGKPAVQELNNSFSLKKWESVESMAMSLPVNAVPGAL